MNKHFKSTFAHMFVAKKNNIVLSFVRYSSSKPKSTIDWERRACFFATKHVPVLEGLTKVKDMMTIVYKHKNTEVFGQVGEGEGEGEGMGEGGVHK